MTGSTDWPNGDTVPVSVHAAFMGMDIAYHTVLYSIGYIPSTNEFHFIELN